MDQIRSETQESAVPTEAEQGDQAPPDAHSVSVSLFGRLTLACRRYAQVMRAEKPLQNQISAYWRMQKRLCEERGAETEWLKEKEKLARKAVRTWQGEVPASETITATAMELEFDPVTLVLQAHRKALEKSREVYGKMIDSLATELPDWPWAEQIPGHGARNHGLIHGALGAPLWPNYANPAKAWKRLGLAVIDGGAQRRISSGRGKKEKHPRDIIHPLDECKTCLALEHGFSPHKRAIMHVVGESLMMQNKLADGSPGEYRQVYLERKDYERDKAPELKPFIHHKRAMRYMEKRFIRNMWVEWKRCAAPHPF